MVLILQGRLQKINDLASVGLRALRNCSFNREDPLPPYPAFALKMKKAFPKHTASLQHVVQEAQPWLSPSAL